MNSIILNATITTGCTTVLMRDYESCDGKSNVTIMATFEGIREYNVTFLQQVMTITLNRCKAINE